MSSTWWFLLSIGLFAVSLVDQFSWHLHMAAYPVTMFAALLTIFHARDVRRGEQSE